MVCHLFNTVQDCDGNKLEGSQRYEYIHNLPFLLPPIFILHIYNKKIRVQPPSFPLSLGHRSKLFLKALTSKHKTKQPSISMYSGLFPSGERQWWTSHLQRRGKKCVDLPRTGRQGCIVLGMVWIGIIQTTPFSIAHPKNNLAPLKKVLIN